MEWGGVLYVTCKGGTPASFLVVVIPPPAGQMDTLEQARLQAVAPVAAGVLLTTATVLLSALALAVLTASPATGSPPAPSPTRPPSAGAAERLPVQPSSVAAYAPSPWLAAGDVISGMWELDEVIPASDDPYLAPHNLVFDDQGNAYAVWEETRTENEWCDTSRNVRFAYRPAGSAWSAATTIAVAGMDYLVCVYTEGQDRGQSAVAVDKQGRVHVLYTDYIQGTNWNMQHSTLKHMVRAPGPNGAWSQAKKVCDQSDVSGHDVCAVGMDAPDLIVLPDGRLAGIWSEDRYFSYCEAWDDWCYEWGIYSPIVVPCTDNYPKNLNSWLVYGPFSLAAATAAEVTFRRWQRTQPDADYFQWLASVDGNHFYGWQDSGDTGGWVGRRSISPTSMFSVTCAADPRRGSPSSCRATPVWLTRGCSWTTW